jgi:hypothetical protein
MASTFKDVIADLLLSVPSSVTLRLNCEVTGISNSRVDVVDVEAADGFRASFEDVIVTAPSGWLKRNESVFSPPHTPKISDAIHSLGYGNLDKVFIKFLRPFWNAKATKTNGNKQSALGETLSPAFPIEFLFLYPEYAGDTNPAKWRQEIISFSGLPEPFS